ncbi:glycosyltransferase, partial [Hyphomonas sp.]|uniref:glycosyltransferase n=1 Tax=Hyphomonas sp. TaxID=87 RepID=UPI00391A90AE
PLSTITQRDRGTLIMFANPPEMERALAGLGLRRWHKWRIIGAWSWELTAPPRHWARQTRYVSEVWAPSQFVADSFSSKFDCPVRVVPHFVPVSPLPPSASAAPSEDRPLRILTLADARSSLERKNPAAALRMFRAAFPNDQSAEFVFKCRNLSLFEGYAKELHEAAAGDSRITILDQTLTDQDQAALLDRADVILSPHRSEGFGVHLAEAMARGKSVVATGWSGNLEFMSEEGSVLLPYELQPVRDSTGVYRPGEGTLWAEADFEAGVEALRGLAASPDRRAKFAITGPQTIARRLSSGIYHDAVLARAPTATAAA